LEAEDTDNGYATIPECQQRTVQKETLSAERRSKGRIS
jgi:hypothetical protein